MKMQVWRNVMVAAMNDALIRGMDKTGEFDMVLFGEAAHVFVQSAKSKAETYIVVVIDGKLRARGWFEREDGFYLQDSRFKVATNIDCSVKDAEMWSKESDVTPIGFVDHGEFRL